LPIQEQVRFPQVGLSLEFANLHWNCSRVQGVAGNTQTASCNSSAPRRLSLRQTVARLEVGSRGIL
jgi:hypothetical protein